MRIRRSKTARLAELDRRRRYSPSINLLEERFLLASFTVNSSADTPGGTGNSGTLRYVISQLDLSSDPGNTISFSIGSGAQTITLEGSPLSAITRPVLIDGT